MRVAIALALTVILLPSAQAATFGANELPMFKELEVPAVSASEPTIGIPWNTDSLFYHQGFATLRARFGDASDEPIWADVTPPYQIPTNLDPMLVADVDTGRVFAGGLLGPCSSMMYSDDDGDSWLPTINMCSGKDFDHQSIGLGPPAGPIPGLQEGRHVGYYCAQSGTVSCARSLDEGATWGPFQEVPGTCGGFHGHIRVSPITGFVTVPTSSCGDHSGYIASADGGVTWSSHEMPLSADWTNGFDPSIQFSRPGGWMYYGMASEHGVYMALSKDQGATWEPLGGGMGVEPTEWLDVGQFHDPPVLSGVFTNVQAGDDERAAIAFIGLEGGSGKNETLLRSDLIYNCDTHQGELVWHYYVAVTYDAGQTWTVRRISDDPVQVGGIYDVVVDGSGGCRNLLDFQDMDIDSKGRIHIGWADGCIAECAETQRNETQGWRENAARVYRQVGGRGLFAEHDLPSTGPADADGDGIANSDDDDIDGDGIVNADDNDVDGDGIPNARDEDSDAGEVVDEVPSEDTPALGLVLLIGLLAAIVVARRR